MTGEIFGKTACKCSKCGHVWLEELAGLPKSCPARACRSRKWNDDFGKIVVNHPTSEADFVAPEPILPATEKPYETFQKSLCNHGLYKPLCRRCQAAA